VQLIQQHCDSVRRKGGDVREGTKEGSLVVKSPGENCFPSWLSESINAPSKRAWGRRFPKWGSDPLKFEGGSWVADDHRRKFSITAKMLR